MHRADRRGALRAFFDLPRNPLEGIRVKGTGSERLNVAPRDPRHPRGAPIRFSRGRAPGRSVPALKLDKGGGRCL
jgi:hypothetical protein